jgi:hypothetical protein
MKKLVIGLVALVGIAMIAQSADASAGGWRRKSRSQACYTPVPAVSVAQSQDGTGYGTYSYQPTTGYRTYSYEPAPTYRYVPSMRGPARSSAGFRDAGAKVRGEY